MRSAAEVLDTFGALHTWRRAGERAPHKPLLILYALGRLARGEERLVPFADADGALDRLLREFGPVRRSVHPEYPFWRLQRDGVWEVQTDGPLRTRTGNTDPPRGVLLRGGARGGFTPDVERTLRRRPGLARAVAQAVLDAHFPLSIHDDLRAAVGLDGPEALGAPGVGTGTRAPVGAGLPARRPRDPQFRARVLTAYDRRCAVCGFAVRLGDALVGLDAAHVKWHQAGGPDTEANGLALCALHHKLFDRGAFTVTAEHAVVLSEHAHGDAGFTEHLLRFHGRPLRAPQSAAHRPAPEYLAWHAREVFQGRVRPAAPSRV